MIRVGHVDIWIVINAQHVGDPIMQLSIFGQNIPLPQGHLLLGLLKNRLGDFLL